MDSKMLALVDGSLWFMKVGVAAMLIVGAIADNNGEPTLKAEVMLHRTQISKVELVRKVQDRRTRRTSPLPQLAATQHG